MEKAENILKILRDEIVGGKYAHDLRLPSEYELAERFGVNAKTANKAVSILAAERMVSRGRRGQGTKITAHHQFHKDQIAFIGNIKLPYYAEVYHGIQTMALSQRYMVSYLSPSVQIFGDILQMLPFSPIKGIISHGYGKIDVPDIPVLYIDYELQANEQHLHTISSNNYQGGYEIMREVTKRGHRDIVIYFHPNLMKARLTGFHEAMKEAGIADFAERTFFSTEHSDFDAQTALRSIIKKYPDFTALVTGSDHDLLRMVKALAGAGIEWMGKKALTGFGNVAGISDTLPVASVDQHPFHVGARVAQCLIDNMENGAPGQPVRELLDIEILNPHHIPVLHK